MRVVTRSVGAVVAAVVGSVLLTVSTTTSATAATVLTVGPLDVGLGLGNVMPYELQGVPCRAPNVCVEVPYLAEISLTAIPDGADLLNSYIGAASGSAVIYGYSEGAQVASKWINQYGNSAGAPSPAKLGFLLIANPARKYGGYTNAFSQFAGLATPVDTKYQVIDLTRQYDFWSDHPTDTTNQLAMLNALAAAWLIHQDYTGVDPLDPKNVSWKEGNITYVVVPTKVLPIFIPLQIFGFDALAEQLSEQYRPAIDSAYVRPAGVAEALAASLGNTQPAALTSMAKSFAAPNDADSELVAQQKTDAHTEAVETRSEGSESTTGVAADSDAAEVADTAVATDSSGTAGVTDTASANGTKPETDIAGTTTGNGVVDTEGAQTTGTDNTGTETTGTETTGTETTGTTGTNTTGTKTTGTTGTKTTGTKTPVTAGAGATGNVTKTPTAGVTTGAKTGTEAAKTPVTTKATATPATGGTSSVGATSATAGTRSGGSASTTAAAATAASVGSSTKPE